MVYAKCRDPVAINLKNLFRTVDLNKFQFKRKLRRDHPKSIYHSLKAFRANQSQWLCALRISHCKKKSRKAADVVAVKMGEADHVNGLEAPAFFLNGNLGSLTAVNEKTASFIPGHQGSQPPSWKWHHSSGSNQTNI